MTAPTSTALAQSQALYLDLMAKVLTRYGFEGNSAGVDPRPGTYASYVWGVLRAELADRQVRLVEPAVFDPALREDGRDWPVDAEAMTGLKRLANARWCVESVIADQVPGDLVETGVWRGGASIYMRAVLKAHGVTDRLVWCADSFEGLPKPDAHHPVDDGDLLHGFDVLAVSLEEVQANFRRYDLLDDQVRFLKGWFKDTLPTAPVERIAVLRLDGDMYASTMDALDALYDRVSPGGYVIVDDYGLPTCVAAIKDFRAARAITEPIETIDWTGVYWRKS